MKSIYFLALILLNSCSPNDTKPELKFEKPAHFPAILYNLSQNPISRAGFELGRALFYDPLLSRDGSISCADCHQQSAAFTHHGHDLSHGIEDRLGTRNSPPIMNLAWHPVFMWDGGIPNLDLQPIAPIENHLEMDEKLSRVLEKLRGSPKYRALFKKAFGNEEITTERFLKAFSQFMIMCVSADSRYDRFRMGKIRLTDEEMQGMQIVEQKCGSCHSGELFSNFGFADIGLSGSDYGLALITLADSDKYHFKTPSLRNLKFTAPYMHDGRFYTLEEVLEHYSSGQMIDRPTLHPIFRKNPRRAIPLSEDEKTKILAFLNTLNDTAFTKNKLLSQP